MPPKAKFTREEIISSAFEIVKREGIDALTARSLGNKLGSSARPIFTVFNSMEEVQHAVISYANDLYNQYIKEGLKESLAFKGVGKAYIKFAIEQPKLFQLLFMREQDKVPDKEHVIGIIDMNSEKILCSIRNGYGLSEKTAKELYFHTWIYTHGIAVLLATKVCDFSNEQISDMLTEIFVSLLKKIKEDGKS